MIRYNKIIGMMYDEQSSFISTWNTANTSAGSSTSTQVKLPLLSSGTYNFTVQWGDGNSDVITVWNQAQTTHTYASSGTYTISINGTIQGWAFQATGDRLKILTIVNWGTLKPTNSPTFLGYCANLNLSSVAGTLDLTGVTSFSSWFRNSTALTTINGMDSWDTSNITDLSLMFYQCSNFNQNLGSWNVSNVTSFYGMFGYNSKFTNGGSSTINSWVLKNTGTIDMSIMFQNASLFNQPIGSWDTSRVTSMTQMFESCAAFNQNISTWNTGNVITMSNMFWACSNFSSDISGWNVGNVTTFSGMFAVAHAFNRNLGAWNVSKCTNFSFMFYANNGFNNGGSTDINNWTLKATGSINMDSMFRLCYFNQPIGSWNMVAVTNMYRMFRDNTSFNQSVGSWNTSAVTDMGEVFNVATAFNQNIGSWNVSNVTNFVNFMFGKTASDFSTANLDAIYNGWSALGGGVKPSKVITFGTAKYTAASSAGRAILTGSPNNWAITDGGI